MDELRSIEGRLRLKYKTQLERKIQRAKERYEGDAGITTSSEPAAMPPTANTSAAAAPAPQFKDAIHSASNFAGGLFARVKGRLNQKETVVPAATVVDLPPMDDAVAPAFAAPPTTAAAPAAAAPAPPMATAGAPVSGNSAASDWTGTDIAAATDGITNFSIGDDDDDADLLAL